MLVFFLPKCVRNAVKTMVVDRKKQKTLALLYLASKPLRKAANSSGVPTEFFVFCSLFFNRMFYSITQQGFTNVYKNIFLSLDTQIAKKFKKQKLEGS